MGERGTLLQLDVGILCLLTAPLTWLLLLLLPPPQPVGVEAPDGNTTSRERED